MSKKKNGKHISGDPRKNSKPMYYKGFEKEKKPEILCSRILYDRMVEKTSMEIKNMGVFYTEDPSSNVYGETPKEIEKLIRKTTDDDDLDFLSTFLWSDSPYPQFSQCDSVCLLRMKNDNDPYCRIPYLNSSMEVRMDDIDKSRIIFFGKRDHYNENSKNVVLVKKGRDLFQMRVSGIENLIDLNSVGLKKVS